MRIDQIVQLRVKNPLVRPVKSKANLDKIQILFHLSVLLFKRLSICCLVVCLSFSASHLRMGKQFTTSKEKRIVIKPPPINTGPEKVTIYRHYLQKIELAFKQAE